MNENSRFQQLFGWGTANTCVLIFALFRVIRRPRQESRCLRLWRG